jgi:hypothetical protein
MNDVLLLAYPLIRNADYDLEPEAGYRTIDMFTNYNDLTLEEVKKNSHY